MELASVGRQDRSTADLTLPIAGETGGSVEIRVRSAGFFACSARVDSTLAERTERAIDKPGAVQSREASPTHFHRCRGAELEYMSCTPISFKAQGIARRDSS